MIKYSSWLKDFEQFEASEKKRVGKPRKSLVGAELGGSFKTLSIDWATFAQRKLLMWFYYYIELYWKKHINNKYHNKTETMKEQKTT